MIKSTTSNYNKTVIFSNTSVTSNTHIKINTCINPHIRIDMWIFKFTYE